eukprot:TRINITY_DN24915_c0_g2_i1.p1 TRINITY_DN24915_c0_g2~~TRINITY_DN24915_c0_g2_i1.p1  ORF type:complete len:153 (-),score=18.18 TRINITY_DN24915_c0_g2_i1:81-539(-)
MQTSFLPHKRKPRVSSNYSIEEAERINADMQSQSEANSNSEDSIDDSDDGNAKAIKIEDSDNVRNNKKISVQKTRKIRKGKEKIKEVKPNRRYQLPAIKSRGYIYWKNIVRRDHVPNKDQWKVIEREIMLMRRQKERKKSFNLVKLSELIFT